MEKGTDQNELFVNQNIKDIVIEYNGKEWDFQVRNLTWKERGDCMTAATKIDIDKRNNKSVRVDMPSYNIAYLMKAIVKAPFPVKMPSFLKLDEAVGEKLVEAIIGSGDESELDEGNSEMQ